MTNKNLKAFTLVELIVVITILAILGTIAFISLQGYSSQARDSVRISDISNIEKGLGIMVVESGKVSIPEDNIELVSSGVTIGYQGFAGVRTLDVIGIFNGGKDPLDETYYTYRINANANTYQLMGFLEDGTEISGFLPGTYAADLTNREPITRGGTLGILLDKTTKAPLQENGTGELDIRLDTTLVDMYLSNTSKKTGTIQEFYGTMENLAISQNFYEPKKECGEGFIKVPGNMDFGQPAFCVAKYEMSYDKTYATPEEEEAAKSTGSGIDWNTVSYTGTLIPVSMSGKYPIADITQPEAIAACESMGEGYHLITNNEWMTIARNTESQPINWSGGLVGENFLYNGVSNGTSGCNIDLTSTTGRRWATTTGDSNCTGLRNKLTLSNGKEIRDLSGNLWEHVNKANTIDGTGFDTGTNPDLLSENGRGEWSDVSSSDRSLYGPFIGVDATYGIGKIYQGDGKIFIRGATAYNASNAGVFRIALNQISTNQNESIGFRCAR